MACTPRIIFILVSVELDIGQIGGHYESLASLIVLLFSLALEGKMVWEKGSGTFVGNQVEINSLARAFFKSLSIIYFCGAITLWFGRLIFGFLNRKVFLCHSFCRLSFYQSKWPNLPSQGPK